MTSFGSNTSRGGSKKFPELKFIGGDPIILSQDGAHDGMFSAFAMFLDFFVLQRLNKYKVEKDVCFHNNNQTEIHVAIDSYKPGQLFFIHKSEKKGLDLAQFQAQLLSQIRSWFIGLSDELAVQMYCKLKNDINGISPPGDFLKSRRSSKDWIGFFPQTRNSLSLLSTL